MSFTEIVDLSSDDELGVVDVKSVKLVPGFVADTLKLQGYCNGQLAKCLKSNTQSTRQESKEIRSSNALSTGQSSISMLEQGQSLVNDTSLTSSATVCPAPLCRQFWKAGNYEDGLGSKVTHQNGKNYLHVHPMFLHSNATSHKWAFGAIAELLDNAVDEIQNGATFVIVDKTSNPRDGSPALLIQDDGGGMDAEAMRRCMSFGFSDRKSKSSIGKYGNGFKTSSMRLGADVIVFSRCVKNRILSQSVGLLSYTFLSQTGHDRIVVPMVDYEFNALTGTLEHRNAREHYTSNLSMLLQWSPYHTEAELLKQFNDVGAHGTKVIIYNLWFNDDGTVELDFDTDPEDICIGGDTREGKQINDQHIAYRLRYSLRQYLSILYLRMPQSFNIILRGRVVEHHNIANDLKYPEFILYKPQSGGCVEGEVITTIGFLKEAPQVNIQGFNVYHKNRLILPFWQVVSYSRSRGRGVVGVLEANFIEPTHNKQDFERTTLFQKLEGRLKEMTLEYWDFHCEYIGYQATKKPRAPMSPQVSSYNIPLRGKEQPVMLRNNFHVGTSNTVSIDRSFSCPAAHSPYNVAERVKQLIPNSHGVPKQGSGMKRKELGISAELEMAKRQVGKGGNVTAVGKMQPSNTTSNHQEVAILLEENKKLQAMCTENEQREKELNIKAMQLRSEVEECKKEYSRLLAEMQLLDPYMDMSMDMYYNVNV